MEPWVVGLVALVVVGLAVIAYGALSDRARNRRRAAAMLAPPDRAIPGLAEAAQPPRYVSAVQARRRPGSATAGSGPSTGSGHETPPPGPGSLKDEVELRAGYASADFVTDEGGRRVVLDDPYVVVCEDEVETVRELLPVIEPALRGRRALVLVAPGLGAEVLDTLEVNALQRRLAVVAVLADAATRQQVCEATGAQPLDRPDRQSGYVTPDRFGRASRWVSTSDESRLSRHAA